jgi:abortive infection bacteriophage resistance protein
LRLLVTDAIERVEAAILRTRMVEQFTIQHGPFGYCEPTNFSPKLEHERLVSDIDEAVKRSKEEFVMRFQNKYTDERYLPLWIVAELMTFGQLFTFFRHLHREEKKQLADSFYLFSPVLESWLHTLNFTRNACAHHARLWNRKIPIQPKLPNKKHKPEWYQPVKINNQRVFAILTILNYLLTYITPQTNWKKRLFDLLLEYDEIPIEQMGFPDNWKESPLWQTHNKGVSQ